MGGVKPFGPVSAVLGNYFSRRVPRIALSAPGSHLPQVALRSRLARSTRLTHPDHGGSLKRVEYDSPGASAPPRSEFWRPDNRKRSGPDLGGGRVLIVDDEPEVCVYVALALKRLGFESSARTDPWEALDLLLENPTQFRLLLTDQRMPGLSGLDLINSVWGSHPDFPVVLMSGYAWGFDASALPGVGFLGKPFEIADLERALRQALRQE